MSELKVPNPPLLVAWISLQARLNQPSKCQWSFDQCTNRTLFPSLQTLLRGGRRYVPHRIWGRKFSGILCSFPPRRKISWRILSVPKSCTPFTNSTSHNNQNLHDTVENSHSQNSPTDTTSRGHQGHGVMSAIAQRSHHFQEAFLVEVSRTWQDHFGVENSGTMRCPNWLCGRCVYSLGL